MTDDVESASENTAQYQRYDLAGDDRQTGLLAAARAVSQGQCIVLPTDTVYGIGADARNPIAVKRLLNAKHRGRDMPPPVLIAEPAMLPALVSDVSEVVSALTEQFWPGALTLIMEAQEALEMDLGETYGTIAVRVPADDDARELLRYTGPLAVSSANISGKPAAINIDQAIEMLGDSVAVYLDGGLSKGQVASTIIDFASEPGGKILRAGALSFEQLVEYAPELKDIANKQTPADASNSAPADENPATEE